MGALALHTRAELRRRWRAWLGVAVLIGLVFGLVLASVAGARRTDTAFARMLDESRAWHVLVNPHQGTGSALRPEAVAALPGVEQIGTFMGMGVLHPGPDGESDFAMSTIAPVEPGTLTEAFRPNVLEGRLFDPTRPDEALIGPAMAGRLGIGPGDTIEAQYVDFEQLAAYEAAGGEGLPPTIPVRFTVVGVVVHPAEISADELFAAGYVSLTPAFWAQHEGEAFWFAVVVRLTDGPAGVPAFRRAVEQLVPDEAIELQTIASVADAVGRGTRPVVVALLAFAAAVGAAGLVVCGQAVTRLVLGAGDDAGVLRSLGVERRHLVLGALGRVILVAAVGAFLAVVVAVVLSPLFPIGVARPAEPRPGFSVDPAVLGPLAAGLVLLFVAWAVVPARRVVRVGAPARLRPSAIVARLSVAGAPPAAVSGVRMAVEPAGDRAVPVRATLLGVAAAVAAVGTALTFGANLDRFVDDPERYGWGWDVLVNLSLEGPEGDIAIRDRSITADLLAVEDLEVTAMAMDRVVVGGRPLPAIGIAQLRGGAGPAITAGRMPDGPDELALGSRTMAELGLAVGDTVPVGEGGSARELRVVGQVVFPGLGTYQGADRTELGVGVLLPTEALDQVGAGFNRPWIALRAPHDTAREATDAVLARHFERLGPERMEVLREPQRPSDVVNLGRVRATPLALTATLALLAAASLTHVLFSTIRWRRRDLAVLKALGFSRRQVRATVAWKATTVAVVALAVGLPLGAVGGRWAWSLLASGLGVPAQPLLPLALLLVVPAVVLVANLAAAVPGRMAAGTPAAVVLRAE